MILSFKGKEAGKIWERKSSKKLPLSIQQRAYDKLLLLNASTGLKDLMIPSANRLEKLVGDRKDQYSIRINEQWRICFSWDRGDAYNVEILDYH
ncbi:MAG TPA: type II toxin-antitoxin system RelE/ParE family toxin [Spirochaetes bacterium]|nr:type II toxin-antitoxin system RelE/ParE family toxin [Spirochaetota bacterium]